MIALDCGPHMHTLSTIEVRAHEQTCSSTSRRASNTHPCCTQGLKDKTWFTYAVDLIRQVIRVRTIQSEYDKIAVLLYNTVREEGVVIAVVC